MHYAVLAMIGMASYGVTLALLKSAMRTMPPEVALVITNFILVAVGIGYMVFRGVGIAEHMRLNRPMLLVIAAGVTLTIGIITYYTALSRGPTSVVVPIFAMNFAVVSILGILFLGETINLQKVAGLVLASGAIVLLTR